MLGAKSAPTNSEALRSFAVALASEVRLMHQAVCSGQSGLEITRALLHHIEQLCLKLGARAHCEVHVDLYRSGVYRTSKPYRKWGRLDMAVELSDGWRVAIEIDRGNKRWSRDKLIHATSLPRTCALWIRWRGQCPDENCAPGLSLINLTEDPPAWLDHWAACYGEC
ncbi:MAG TPA: hypothetical protein VJU83_09465 [Burkholderiales bacterium]|nr:hypothetical protein [Burkholderiales bacterium]